jgi:SM-20-related protein
MTRLDPLHDTLHDSLLDGLAESGYVIVDKVLSADEVSALAAEALQLSQNGVLKPAAIGRAASAQLDPALRGDAIRWLDETHASPAQQVYFRVMHGIREACNRHLYLNLVELETHFAVYPPGARYSRHLDQFHRSGVRKISSVLYLNRDWQADYGGQLRIYLEGEQPEPYLDVEPIGGRLVLFDASRFYHEVLPATQPRVSLTGWFRTRADHPLI